MWQPSPMLRLKARAAISSTTCSISSRGEICCGSSSNLPASILEKSSRSSISASSAPAEVETALI